MAQVESAFLCGLKAYSFKTLIEERTSNTQREKKMGTERKVTFNFETMMLECRNTMAYRELIRRPVPI